MGEVWIGLEQSVIDTAVSERKEGFHAFGRVVSRHFENLFCKQLKNGQSSKLSSRMKEMWKNVF